MRRAELEHLIRAAAVVADDQELVVIGSQAVLGQFPDAPDELLVSREADVYPRNHPERAIEIDGSLGDGSYFGATGWCLEIHDLLLSKCAAGRERDWQFVEQAVRHGLADPIELRRRVFDLPISAASLDPIRRMVDGVIARSGSADSR
jgi:hypothetical protein